VVVHKETRESSATSFWPKPAPPIPCRLVGQTIALCVCRLRASVGRRHRTIACPTKAPFLGHLDFERVDVHVFSYYRGHRCVTGATRTIRNWSGPIVESAASLRSARGPPPIATRHMGCSGDRKSCTNMYVPFSDQNGSCNLPKFPACSIFRTGCRRAAASTCPSLRYSVLSRPRARTALPIPATSRSCEYSRPSDTAHCLGARWGGKPKQQSLAIRRPGRVRAMKPPDWSGDRAAENATRYTPALRPGTRPVNTTESPLGDQSGSLASTSPVSICRGSLPSRG